jgi:hypothetical protein
MDYKILLPQFEYSFNAGPLLPEFLDSAPNLGNCRLAIQLYFYRLHHKIFLPDEILCPKSYRETGIKIHLDFNDPSWISNVVVGDVIFAERIKDKEGKPIDRSIEYFNHNEEEYITYLHTAIISSKGPTEVWHATTITNNTCYWDLTQFNNYYKIVSVRRFI